ncbi:MAG: DUF5682 family protein [Saprospiraceae bacterium]|nr:DUF5682 family protein [Saprospiraceae bacterium]MDW8485226.1 DUF5682 family protein [Saprospiraceae bacterium]
MANVWIYGIRHHGPGSARSVRAALEHARPDILLVEGPADAEDMLPWIGHADLKPPVALLVYNPKNLKQTAFFPFAEFSPEWQALSYGLQEGIPIRLIDLPMSLAFSLRATLSGDESQQYALYDPFGDLARMGGYTDAERWWEVYFERQKYGDAQEVFSVILTLMQALRNARHARGEKEPLEVLVREAFMRSRIRRTQREGFKRIAVVCGAWHGPALAQVEAISTKSDEALLKPLKRQPTRATWIPWSFDRLARQSNYPAGVWSPAWYQALWNGDAELEHWFSRAAQLLRRKGLFASPAQVIEAVRLAQTLAALRNTPVAGIEELREAAITVLCQGAESAYALIERHLVIGDALGQTPADVPRVPLIADFEAQARSARLKLSPEEEWLELDLREEAHLRKSRLLHRTKLVGVPWGREQIVRGRKEGRFHEQWVLRWLPDYTVQLIEAGQWGGTLEEAAVHYLCWQLSSEKSLSKLVELLSDALKADLPALLEPLLKRLEESSAQNQDILALIDAALPLIEMLRYGHARQLNLEAVEQLLQRLIPRICVQLPGACVELPNDTAAQLLKRVLAMHRVIHLWHPEVYLPLWQEALLQIAERGSPLVAGLCVRLLLEDEVYTVQQATEEMQFRLFHGRSSWDSASWLEGFLHEGGLLLLYRPALWQVLDDWVCALEKEAFDQVLPLLRRTFSALSESERKKLFMLVRHTQRGDVHSRPAELDSIRLELLRPLLEKLFP